MESHLYPVKEGQRYIKNLNPGHLFVQQPPQRRKGSRGSFKLFMSSIISFFIVCSPVSFVERALNSNDQRNHISCCWRLGANVLGRAFDGCELKFYSTQNDWTLIPGRLLCRIKLCWREVGLFALRRQVKGWLYFLLKVVLWQFWNQNRNHGFNPKPNQNRTDW